MDDDQFLEAYLNTLEVSEGTEGGDTVTGMATRPYGVKDLLGVNEEDYKDNPRGLAKAVASKNIDELKRMGIDWDNLPASMKFNALDIQFNMGSLNKKAPKYFKAVKAGKYDTAIKESLDAIGAYDPKRKGERPTKGIALRRAMLYNMVADEFNYPKITSINAINQDNPQKSAKVTYNLAEGEAIPVTYDTYSLHSTTKPGKVAVSETLGITAQPVTGEDTEDFSDPLPVPSAPKPKPEQPVVPTPQPKPVTPETKAQTDEAFTLDYEGELPDIGDDVPMPDLPATDVAPDTTDAIPPAMVDVPEEKNIFERAYDYMFGDKDTPEEIQQREQTRQRLLQSLEMNEGGVATAIQESRDIETGADTRTKQEILSDQMAGLGVVGKTAVESVPGVGEAIVAKEVAEDVSAGDYLSAGLGTAALGMGFLPAGDVLNKPLRAAAKKFRKQDIEDAAPSWFKETEVSKDIKPEDAKKTQITTTTATYEKAKDILPEGRTLDFGAGKGVGAKKVGSDTYEPFADESFSPTYTDAKAIPSNSYDNITSLNVLNVVKPETRSEIVQDIGRILKPGGTGIITTRGMDVFGNSKNPVRGILADEPRAVITSSGTYQKGFTQKELREYIAEELGESFTVSDVSGLGKAGVKIKKKSDNLNMAEGGMAIEKQMEMFEDGGLMDEGGTVDPVSGNDVPPGSTQEEVRDDIPAQLSEGEFVFPADVVRYIGLEKLMQMRQEAKMGLQRMEDMGQMGNSEEAVMPDNLPFDLDDLEMEDEPMEFQVGGLVPNQYGVYQQPSQFASYSQQPYQAPTIPTGQPIQQQPIQAAGFQTLPVQQVPTAPTTVPTFEQLMPTTTGQYDELREYINEETGQSMTIPFVDGKPIYPIPQGFTPKPTEQVEAAVPETTAVPTAQVEQVSGGDEDRVDDGLGPGGGRVTLGGEIFEGPTGFYGDGIKSRKFQGNVYGGTQVGVSFDTPGGLPGIMSAGSTALSLATGKGIAKDVTATFTLGNERVTVDAVKYNRIKEANFRGEEAESILNDLQNKAKVTAITRDRTRAKSRLEKAKKTGEANKIAAAELEIAQIEARKMGIDVEGKSKDQLKTETLAAVQRKAQENAARRAAEQASGGGSSQYESDKGDFRYDSSDENSGSQGGRGYSFESYSDNVAKGTEDRGYGAAYDEDVLGLAD